MSCPYLVTGKEGTGYCRLAEDSARELERLRAETDEYRRCIKLLSGIVQQEINVAMEQVRKERGNG